MLDCDLIAHAILHVMQILQALQLPTVGSFVVINCLHEALMWTPDRGSMYFLLGLVFAVFDHVTHVDSAPRFLACHLRLTNSHH